jgi:capsular exopolysaccharide synthesis family protein
MLDSSVKTRSDLVNLKLPFLAEIPQMGLNGSYWKRLRTNRFDDSNCNIIVQGGKRDMMNEAFRVLRTNLDLMVGQKEGCHVVMVTSFTPNAGKTFTIMNMAASMAIKGSRVLLLDLDLRKATLSKSLERNNHGVSAYLNGKSEHILDSVQHVAEHLDIISVGTLPPNPAELLVSDRFKTMVEELKDHYDYIFFDCPPIDIVADTSIVAAHADLTVFIVRAGMFDKPGIAVLNDLYESGKYNRMSLILNGVESFSRGYGHYGYGYGHYGYGYGYGYGEHEKD